MWVGGIFVVALFSLIGFIANGVLNTLKENTIRDDKRYELIQTQQLALLDKISQTNEHIATLTATVTHMLEMELPNVKSRIQRIEDRVFN